MLDKINRILSFDSFGSCIKFKDIKWKRVSYKLRQCVAIIPRLIALPFFIIGLSLVLIAIIPANIAEQIQRLANRIER